MTDCKIHNKDFGENKTFNIEHNFLFKCHKSYVCCIVGHEQVVQLLLFYGASLNELDAWKRSPLMLTAHEGHTSLLEQLLQAGCSVNLRSLEGRSSLHYATIFGHISCVEKLLEKEADVNLYDSNGATPLNYAAKEGLPTEYLPYKVNFNNYTACAEAIFPQRN